MRWMDWRERRGWLSRRSRRSRRSRCCGCSSALVRQGHPVLHLALLWPRDCSTKLFEEAKGC